MVVLALISQLYVLEKLGSCICPLDVIRNCTFNLWLHVLEGILGVLYVFLPLSCNTE